MIPKGTNVVVNFYATDSGGIPLSTASGITPYYRLGGGAKSALACNIYSIGSDAPGWFSFSTSHFNTSTGNLFITFSNSSNYVIMPWEDDIVSTGGGGSTASEIWNYSTRELTTDIPTIGSIVSGVWGYSPYYDYDYDDTTTLSALWRASTSAFSLCNSWYSTFSNLDLSTALDNIPFWVWNHSDRALTTNVLYRKYASSSSSWGALPLSTSVPNSSDVANGVWGYVIHSYIDSTTQEEVTISAGSYLKDIKFYTTPLTNSFNSLKSYGDANWVTATGFATPTNVTDATTTITGSIAAITIPTPPTTSEIADSVWGYTLSSKIIGNAIPSVTDIWGDSSVRSLTYYPDFPSIPTPPTTGEIAASVWNYTSSSRLVDNTFMSSADVWSYQINGSSAGTYLGYIGTWPTAGDIATSVWSHGNGSERIVNNTIPSVEDIWGDSSARSLTYYPEFPTVPTTGDIATSVWGTIIGGSSASVYLTSINGSIGTINTSITGINSGIGSLNSTVAYLDAGFFNWRISTNKLITSVSNTEVEYTVSRDINSNIIGIRPVQ